MFAKKSFLLLLLLVCFKLSEAQKISGKVSDAADGQVLIGAVVVWQGTRSGTVTDYNGKFELSQPPGATHLIVSYISYTPDTIPYSGENVLEIKLKATTVDGGAIIIEDERSSTTITSLNPLNFQTLGKKELCKAACCNLSESFETNASIDASFADAITGTKQIRMLGLDGKYTQMMFDNMPAIRGLASTYGLTYVPGPWVNNIYIAKGVGSVVAGFESITGQINVEYKNPETAEPLYVNAYLGTSGRTELNLIWTPGSHDESVQPEKGEGKKQPKVRHNHFRPVFLAHGAMSTFRTDMNGDGFLDNPLFTNIILRNEWHLTTEKGIGAQFAATWLKLNNVSGKLDYNPKDEIRSQLWGVNIATDKYDLTAKVGYVFPNKTWKSFGSQYSIGYHKQSGNYGFREYNGEQISGRVNLLYATRIKTDAHKITTGLSYLYDHFNERVFYKEFPPVLLSSMPLSRMESVGGAFAEYTLNWKDRLIVVAGIRGDYHNRYGLFFTPRIHTRYSFTDKTSIKVLGGKGYRTANLLMDNVGILASNRNFVVEGNDPDGYFGLKMEEAWNTGVILTHKFKLNHRDAVLSVDAYRTDFVNQVVMDIEEAGLVRFYNLNGKSYSNSAQAEMQWSPIKRLEWRLAYRWLDVKTDYESGLLEKPLVNKHRAFTNLAFATREKKNGAHWRFDATLQWIGTKRLPAAAHTDSEIHLDAVNNSRTNAYYLLNAQVTYIFRKQMELYVGGENLTNFMLHEPIISSNDPSNSTFDGSLVWGPVFGRMGYVGFRWWV